MSRKNNFFFGKAGKENKIRKKKKERK